MGTNRGTFEGDLQEVSFVKYFNKNKNLFNEYLSAFQDTSSLTYLLRVTTKQYSKLSGKKVYTRADAYLANFTDNSVIDLLMSNDYYLDEEILKANNINFKAVEFSGISIKLSDSNKFQILKLQPNSFANLFGNHELGAGASLFCNRIEELPKNNDLILGWGSSIEKMNLFFNDITKNNLKFQLDQEMCRKIKQSSEQKIHSLIDNDISLQKKIFNGVNLYDEPYTAYYFSKNNTIQLLTYIPFTVTTGSGRSHGDYTIVLKPR